MSTSLEAFGLSWTQVDRKGTHPCFEDKEDRFQALLHSNLEIETFLIYDQKTYKAAALFTHGWMHFALEPALRGWIRELTESVIATQPREELLAEFEARVRERTPQLVFDTVDPSTHERRSLDVPVRMAIAPDSRDSNGIDKVFLPEWFFPRGAFVASSRQQIHWDQAQQSQTNEDAFSTSITAKQSKKIRSIPEALAALRMCFPGLSKHLPSKHSAKIDPSAKSTKGQTFNIPFLQSPYLGLAADEQDSYVTVPAEDLSRLGGDIYTQTGSSRLYKTLKAPMNPYEILSKNTKLEIGVSEGGDTSQSLQSTAETGRRQKSVGVISSEVFLAPQARIELRWQKDGSYQLFLVTAGKDKADHETDRPLSITDLPTWKDYKETLKRCWASGARFSRDTAIIEDNRDLREHNWDPEKTYSRSPAYHFMLMEFRLNNDPELILPLNTINGKTVLCPLWCDLSQLYDDEFILSEIKDSKINASEIKDLQGIKSPSEIPPDPEQLGDWLENDLLRPDKSGRKKWSAQAKKQLVSRGRRGTRSSAQFLLDSYLDRE